MLLLSLNISPVASLSCNGKPDNDFLVYLPVYDMWQEQPGRLLLFSIHDMAKRAPKFIETVHTISNCGYDMDYISDNFVKAPVA